MQPHSRRTVVFLESAAAMGGVQFSTLYLAQALDRSRWHPVVICPSAGDLSRACRDAGIETQVLTRPRFWSTSVRAGRMRLPNPFAWMWNAFVLLRAARRMRTFLEQRAPDVLVTKGLQSHFIGGLAARRANVPCVWHVQDVISERTFGIYQRVFGFAARRLPRQIIVDGAAIKNQLPQSIHQRVSIVYNGVDTNVFHPARDGSPARTEFGITQDQIVIGHAGRVTPWKGQHYLIEAFASVANKFSNAVLLFAGSPVFDHDAYEQRLRRLAAELHLEKRIIFAGYRHDLPDVLAAMDVFAFTSIEKDTSPLALLSAMASGLPIVAFDIEGVRELAADDEALRVPVGDTAELAKAIESVILEGGRRSHRAKAARQLAEDKFDLRRYVDQMEDVLAGSITPNQNSVDSHAPAAATQAKRRPRILFVHNALTEFVNLDLDALREFAEVTERFEQSRFINPIALWRDVRKHDLVFGWFASWHTFLPVQFAKRQGKPTVLVCGGYDVADMPEIGYGHQRGGLKKWMSRRLMHDATRIITNSDFSRAEIARHVGLTNGCVKRIFHGLPDRVGRLPERKERLALTVGNVDRSNLKRKGHEPFVRAAAFLPDVKFVLVGGWKDDAVDYLRSIATPNVEITGRVADDVLLDYYRKASVYVQPSLHEGFGMSVAEAMLAGCVPVTTTAGALPEVTGDCGVRIARPDPDAVAAAVNAALASPDEARASIRSHVLQNFPLGNRSAQLRELIEQLANNH